MAEALRDATYNGDLARLRAVLKSGFAVDTRDPNGWTALHCAALNGRTACLKALLAAGASVHSATNRGSTPLHFASMNGEVVCVRALIAAGSDVNRAVHNGSTPVSLALLYDRRRVLKILLRAGADVHTETGTRNNFNAEAWALVDEIRDAGGWANYVARHPPATFASVVDKATSGALPDPIPLIIATFLVPAGGF